MFFNLPTMLIIQGYTKEQSQSIFDQEMLSNIPQYQKVANIKKYLEDGDIIYDLLDEEAKEWINRNICLF